jgi:hypothetical protein
MGSRDYQDLLFPVLCRNGSFEGLRWSQIALSCPGLLQAGSDPDLQITLKFVPYSRAPSQVKLSGCRPT